MGQTLTHGIYLPDEGERNCYNGLAGNWQLLDGAVGTVAEHTTALAGKAPLVHTHSKADITDFPVYGTTAGTICEGNDSRLSDARTPVAHTHVTSEVLKTGSARTASPQTNFYFKIASWEMGANQYFGAELLVQNSNYTQNRATVTISVRTSLSYTLAAGYLYLSNDLGFNREQFYICYKEESNKVLFELYHYMPITWNGIKFSVISEFLNKSSFVIELFNTMTVYNRIYSDAVADLPTGYTAIEAKYLPLSQDINPASNNTYNFGTSSYQWNNLYAKKVNTQSVNGINPGALSLPRGYTEEGADKHYINIASTIQTLDGTLYYYTMPDNGWISVRAEQANQVHVTTDNWKFGQSIYSNTVTTLIVSTPFRKGDTVAIKVIATTLEHARFYPMQGNV